MQPCNPKADQDLGISQLPSSLLPPVCSHKPLTSRGNAILTSTGILLPALVLCVRQAAHQYPGKRLHPLSVGLLHGALLVAHPLPFHCMPQFANLPSGEAHVGSLAITNSTAVSNPEHDFQ